jgi:hypothetical protein
MSLKSDEIDAEKRLDGYCIRAHMYYFDKSNMPIFGIPVMDRINGIAIAHQDADMNDTLRDIIISVIGDVDRRVSFAVYKVFAEDLKSALIQRGIYGVSIWDARDKNVYMQKARTISKGRLVTAYERHKIVYKWKR